MQHCELHCCFYSAQWNLPRCTAVKKKLFSSSNLLLSELTGSKGWTGSAAPWLLSHLFVVCSEMIVAAWTLVQPLCTSDITSPCLCSRVRRCILLLSENLNIRSKNFGLSRLTKIYIAKSYISNSWNTAGRWIEHATLFFFLFSRK